jgi:hypothetical protein
MSQRWIISGDVAQRAVERSYQQHHKIRHMNRLNSRDRDILISTYIKAKVR